MKWNVAAPFFETREDRWIDDFVPGNRHQFDKVALSRGRSGPGWHGRIARTTPLNDWALHWHAAGKALRDADGVITVFPQLAAVTALRRQLGGRRDKPIVAWCFNLGLLVGGVRRAAAQFALRDVERFVVHSTAEVRNIADYLAVEKRRVQFVPLQHAPIPLEVDEEQDTPFVLAMGSANRDYATLMRAARIAALPVTVVAAPRAVAGLDVPPNVTLLTDLTPHDCHLLAQRARISIVPLADVGAASGQVTVVEALWMRRPLIATRSIGTVDYVEDGNTGVLVAHGDADALADAMRQLWDDRALRERLASGGAAFAAARLSDAAAGVALERILHEIETERR